MRYHLALIAMLPLVVVAGPIGPNRPSSLGRDHLAQNPLQVVQSYGWEEPTDSPRPLSPLEERYGGGVLSHISGIAEGPDGALYVGDRDFQKIVVFNHDGSLRRVIVGGFGRGPGEFTMLWDLAVSDDGLIAVLDEALNRVSLFDTTGAFKGSFTILKGHPMQVMFGPGGLYVLQWVQLPDDPLVEVYSVEGERTGSYLTPDARELHFAHYGEPGCLSKKADGTVIYVHPSPGLWFDVRAGAARPHGRELFPDVQGRTIKQGNHGVLKIEVGTRGVVAAEQDRIGVLYSRWMKPEAVTPQLPRYMLAVIDTLGNVQESVDLTAALGDGVYRPTPSRDPAEFYIANIDPYPRVMLVRTLPDRRR